MPVQGPVPPPQVPPHLDEESIRCGKASPHWLMILQATPAATASGPFGQSSKSSVPSFRRPSSQTSRRCGARVVVVVVVVREVVVEPRTVVVVVFSSSWWAMAARDGWVVPPSTTPSPQNAFLQFVRQAPGRVSLFPPPPHVPLSASQACFPPQVPHSLPSDGFPGALHRGRGPSS